MDRRTCLVGVGTVAIAGCLGFGEDESEDAESTGNESADSDSEGRQSATDSASDAESEPESPTTEEDPESEPEPEPTDDRQETSDEIEFERSLARAEEQYRLALREYGRSASGDDPTFLDVLPSDDVDAHNARKYLDRAGEILWTETRDKAVTADHEAQVREYRTYDDVIVDLSRIQRYLHAAYTRIEPVDDKPTYSSPPSELDSAREDHDALGEEFSEMELYMDALETKHNQQAWQIELLERTFTGLVNLRGPEYTNSQSTTQLQLARNELRTVRNELSDPTSAPPEGTTDDDFLDLVTEWYELADEALREAST